MKAFIPIAGIGKRLRPFTLNTPKPFIKIADKTILEYLIDSLNQYFNNKITSLHFILRKDILENFSNFFEKIKNKYNLPLFFYFQEQQLGTAHAIYCAKENLSGEAIIAFGDTIFFNPSVPFNAILLNCDSIIFTKQVENPSQYGVVLLNEKGEITNFIEKPKTFVSNQAITGLYYFKNIEKLNSYIKTIIEKNIKGNNEYQLTDALIMMLKDNYKFKNCEVEYWLDCGSLNQLLFANKIILTLFYNNTQDKISKNNSLIIQPSFISNNVNIKNSIIGPYVSISENVNLENCIIKNSIIMKNTFIKNCVLTNSIIGENCSLVRNSNTIYLGNFSSLMFDNENL